MQPEHDFGQHLRQLRVAADLTQETLAEQVGCAAQTIRAFESGRRRPSRDMAARLAFILHLPPDARDSFVRLARSTPMPQGNGLLDDNPGSPPPVPNMSPPLPSGALIGRQHDLQLLYRALRHERQRMVTLLGPGGVGKTRLALQAVAELNSAFADGAVFVALAAVADAPSVLAAIAASVGCPLAGTPDPLAQLLSFLHSRTLLLVLDNLEQLLAADQGDEVVALLAALLGAGPGVFLLVTSRERLRLQSEWVMELGGLGLPTDDQATSIARSDAVLLFVERAQRTSGSFVLGPHNQLAVAQICRRLDGIPLALELAAAQTSFLPPTALLARLDKALPLLEGGARDLPQRQRTMRATIGWSHDLLRPDERRLFQRLGVFVGGFSLDAAAAVGADDTIASEQVLGLLRRLVDQSLVAVEAAADDVRYWLLEPVRQYALERLAAQPVELEATRGRHAAFFHALAERAFPFLRGPEQVRWATLLEQEYPNLHAAIEWMLAQGDLDAAAHCIYALWLFLWVRGHFRAGQTWAEQLMRQLPPAPSVALAHATIVACVLAYGQAEYARAAPLADECLAMYRALAHAEGMAYGLSMVGLIAAAQGEFARATEYMAAAVEQNLAIGEPSHIWSAAMTLTYWAPIPLAQGDYPEAARLARRALGLAQTIGDRIGVYSALYTLALVEQAEGDLEEARQQFAAALRLAVELGDVGNSVACLHGLASTAAGQGHVLRALQLYAAADALRAAHTAARYAYTIDDAAVAGAIAALRAQLSSAVFDDAWAAGHALTFDAAVAYALEA